MPRPTAPAARNTTKAPGPSSALIGGVTAAVVALVAIVVYLVARGDGTAAAGSAQTLPEGGGLVVSAADAPADAPTVRIYEDFQCPACAQLETAVGEAFTQAADAGEIVLQYTFMSFLDGMLGNDSSSRAANAALCADDAGVFTEFHSQAYAQQPQEGVGFAEETLLGFGADAGLSGDALSGFTSCVQDDTYGDYVDDMQEAANREGVTGTPTIEVNGTELDRAEMGRLQQDPSSLNEIVGAHS